MFRTMNQKLHNKPGALAYLQSHSELTANIEDFNFNVIQQDVDEDNEVYIN